MKRIEKFRIDAINKQLEPHGVKYDDVKNTNWYNVYSQTEEEYESWRSWCIDELKRRFKLDTPNANREFQWFCLMYKLSKK